MSDGIVGNLRDAWGVEDGDDGPDPTTLPGLLEFAEQWLESEENDPAGICGNFEEMKNRLVGGHMERERALKEGNFDPIFVEIVQKNLNDMETVEEAIDGYLAAAGDGDVERDLCFEALGELEEAIEALKESGNAIDHFLANSPPVCMACKSIGPEPQCPKCGGERLILDPNPIPQDETQTAVTDEVMNVYASYYQVLDGKAPLTSLVTHLQSLEFTYLEVQAIAEQAISGEAATNKMKEVGAEHLVAINATLEGIQMMHSVVQSRKTEDLNAGWRKILKNSVKATELTHKLASLAETSFPSE